MCVRVCNGWANTEWERSGANRVAAAAKSSSQGTNVHQIEAGGMIEAGGLEEKHSVEKRTAAG